MKKLIISSIIMVLSIIIVIILSKNTKIIINLENVGLTVIDAIKIGCMLTIISWLVTILFGVEEENNAIFSMLGNIYISIQILVFIVLVYILEQNLTGLTSILFEIGGIKIEKYIYTADEINELISQMAKNYQVTLTSTEIQELQKCTNPKMIKDELLKIGARWVISQFSIREILSLVLIRIFVTKGQQPKRKQSKRKTIKKKTTKKKNKKYRKTRSKANQYL